MEPERDVTNDPNVWELIDAHCGDDAENVKMFVHEGLVNLWLGDDGLRVRPTDLGRQVGRGFVAEEVPGRKGGTMRIAVLLAAGALVAATNVGLGNAGPDKPSSGTRLRAHPHPSEGPNR